MKQKQKIFRLIMSSYLLLLMAFSFVPSAQADIIQGPINTNTQASSSLPQYNRGVDTSIKDYLCVPDDSNLGGALYTCIGRLYRFGIVVGAIGLIFFIVLAGYTYIAGGEAAKTKAKGMIYNSAIGMALILGSYLLLNFINPDLTKFKTIQPPIFTAVLPSCKDVGFGENCILTDGTVYVPGTGGNGDEQQYATLINKYAQIHSMEYCKLSALLRKESSFIYNNVSNPPPGRVETSSGSPPSYNVSFASSGHGIGLGQIYIYQGQTSRPGGEFGISSPLYVKDLIDPETNIKAASYLWANDLQRANNDIRAAYRLYQGPKSAQSTLDALLQMYTECKTRPQPT